jgi:aspartokinase/homoserine dehydrogenase 1
MPTLRINIVLFGIGNVGSTLINQVLQAQDFFLQQKNIELRFPIITNSTLAFFEKEGVKILGTSVAQIARAENRYEFNTIV